MHDCINEAINKNYNGWLNKATRLCRSSEKGHEILHLVLARLLDRPEQDVIDRACQGKLKQYVDRAIWVSWNSSSSEYYRVYRRRRYEELPAGYEDRADDASYGNVIDGEYIFNYLNRLNEHDAILLRLYSRKDFDYKQLSRETGIPVKYLYKAIENAINRIRKNVKPNSPASGT